MCFSATASFVAGTALSATGVVTLSETKSKKERAFAAVPLLFGIQQIIEGAVWLSFQYGFSSLNKIVTYGFMLFAYVVWPTFMPFAVMSLEPDASRKKFLSMFLVLGLAVSAYLLYFIAVSPVTSEIVNKSIHYPAPKEYGIFVVAMYLFATCVSCLFSSHRIINLFGILSILSFSTAYYFFTTSFVSVWCFFAAILSIMVYLYFTRGK